MGCCSSKVVVSQQGNEIHNVTPQTKPDETYHLPWNCNPVPPPKRLSTVSHPITSTVEIDDKVREEELISLRNALKEHVSELDEIVKKNNKNNLIKDTPVDSSPNLQQQLYHRIGDGLGNQNVMVKDKETLMKTNHQLYWTTTTTEGGEGGGKKTWNVWEWLIGLCVSDNGGLTQGKDTTFDLHDIHCGYGDHPQQNIHHIRRNNDKPTDPHVCCIWHGYKTVVERLVDSKDGNDTLSQILDCGNKKWTLPDFVQGIFATFVYTFEVKKL
eukprot:PhF_6_TR10513/c0_g1_i1/m.16563